MPCRAIRRPLVPWLILAACAGHLSAQAPSPATRDSIVAAAERSLAQGRPWAATRLVAPLLTSPASRTPAVILLAARAAASWEGWSTVRRLLDGQAWLDQQMGGEGRALLARALVELSDADAPEQAKLALRTADSTTLGSRLVVLARALDRANQLDSAATVYLHSAEVLPPVAAWLRLRAAGVTADSAARSALYSGISTPPAAARTLWTEALARDRTGDPAGASRIYERLGAVVASLRLRLEAAATPATRKRVRDDLLASLPTRVPAAEVADAVALLDDNFSPLSAGEELIVARRAGAVGLLDRAVRGFARASRGRPLDDSDRLQFGTVLAGLGRHQEAIARFEAVRSPSERPKALYQRARSLLRLGNEAKGLEALRRVRDSFPKDEGIASAAGWLLADAHADRGDDSTARTEFLEVARRFPGTGFAERSAFQAALLAFVAGNDSVAAREFDALADRQPPGSEAVAASYWSGRAWQVAGDSARAAQRWRAIVERSPQSYYVGPAARRLGMTPFPSVEEAPAAWTSPTLPGLARGALLDSLGLDLEARLEYERVVRDAEANPAGLLGAATALARAGQTARALRLAQRALDKGAAPDVAVLRLLFPLPERDVLETEAPAAGLPPLLVAALIRQESGFDPAARSRAGARGLMQVMPVVGAAVARTEGFPEWDAVLLYQPDVNLHIGLRHLAERWERCGGSPEAALAAYNAGATPVNRWLKRGGTADPEIFIERIPYSETRDYVRRVLYNQTRYEALYRRP